MLKDLKDPLYFRLPAAIILPIAVFIEGYTSIATEMLTIRQLLPVVGSSVIVTSMIIGIFLLFLALGYWQGGLKQVSNSSILVKNFVIAAIWLGIGLSYLVVISFFNLFEHYISHHVLFALSVYLLLFIAPIIFILGQTLPLIIHLSKKMEHAGTIAGSTLALSTLGSFLGALVTALILFQTIGVAYTLVINAFLLILLAFLLAARQTNLILMGSGYILIATSIYLLNVNLEKILFNHTNAYANYAILDHNHYHLKPDEKILLINDNLSSYTNAKLHAFPYIEVIKNYLFAVLKLQNQQILVLGAGGFTLAAEHSKQNLFTFVDIDSQLKKIVQHDFPISTASHFIADDARHFLQHTQQQYMSIIVDVYSDTKAIPAHLLTAEFFQVVRSKLLPNGTAIFNVIANPFLTDHYSKHLDNTIRSSFSECLAYPLSLIQKPTNILYFCSMQKRSPQHVYTDNLNRSSYESFQLSS